MGSCTAQACLKNSMMAKQRELLMYGIPTWLLATIQVGLAFITLIFAGHLGPAMLAGVGLGNTMYNVLLWSVLWGFTSALDTFGPQVYASSEKKHHLGTVTLKIGLQGFVVYVFILGFYLNSTHLVMLLPSETDTVADLHQRDFSPNISNIVVHKIASYANVTIPYVHVPGAHSRNSDHLFMNNLQITVAYMRMVFLVPLLDFIISLISKFLTVQRYIMEVYVISLAMIVLHVMWNLVLVKYLHFGLVGLALAALLTRVVTLILLLIYCWCKRKELAWCGYSSAVCKNWEESFKLGLSGAANLFVEMGMFEIATFLSQFDGQAVLATVVVLFQFVQCFYTIPVGISTATTILIGNALAERNKSEIRSYMKLSILNTVFLAITASLFFYFLRCPLAGLFTSSPDVIDKFTSCIWVFLVLMPFDHLQTVLSRGILISFGRQRFIAISLALICYCIATPLIAVFVFYTNLGPTGILLSFVVFAVLNSISGAIKICTLSLEEEIERADWRATETAGTGSTDDLISCNSYTMNENTPLTGNNTRYAMSEKNVLSLVAVELVFLALMTYFSSL